MCKYRQILTIEVKERMKERKKGKKESKDIPILHEQ